MAKLSCAHFDSTPEDPRVLLASDWAKFISAFIGDGVRNGGDCLSVFADGQGMHTFLSPGFASIQGYFFWCDEDADSVNYRIRHNIGDPTLPRIDRVVLRLDRFVGTRSITPMVIKGVPAADPQPPELVRDHEKWDLSLAQVRIPSGALYIKPENITDERINSSVCGIISGLIRADTEKLYYDFQAGFEAFLDTMETGFNNRMDAFNDGYQDRLNQQVTTVKNWYDIIRLDTSLVAGFDFDNLLELTGTVKETNFFNNRVIESITREDGMALAKRETIFNNKSIISETTLYAEDGESIFKKSITETDFTSGSVVFDRTTSGV